MINYLNFSLAEARTVLEPLALFLLGVVAYAVFIFNFYRFLARRNIFVLNLSQYNKAPLGFIKKIVDSVFYVLEHILLLPLFIFFWFSVLFILLLFLSKEQLIPNILLVSMSLIAAVRITAYYHEDLSRDLAKMLPFALLGVFLLDISYFSFTESFSRIMEIPSYWRILSYYLLFVIALEFLLKALYAITHIFRKPAPVKKKE